MKNIIWMKSIFLILTILSTGFISCNDNPTNPDNKSPLVTSFQGKFVDWNKGDDHRILFLGASDVWNSDKIYASSQIYSNGYFSMTNLDIPTSAWLNNPAYPVFMDGMKFEEYTLACSDSNARVVYGALIIVKDTSNRRAAEVYRQNFSYNFYLNEGLLKHGDFMSQYIYADRNVNLSGKIKYLYSNTTFNRESRMTYNYNIQFKKGWNRRVTYIVSFDVKYEAGKTIITAEINYTNLEPGHADWYYYYY